MAHGRTGPLHRAGQSVRLVAVLSVSIPSKSFAFLANPVPAPAASAVRQVTRQQFGARANPRIMLKQRLATAHVSKNAPAKDAEDAAPLGTVLVLIAAVVYAKAGPAPRRIRGERLRARSFPSRR